jgi:exopolysaccharide biosynthesis WecB/TagA/CpsF family protein
LVLVAMGQPRQEQWAVREAERCGAVSMSIGAYLDFVSGRVSRAPMLVQRLRLEWIYRLAIEPRRMAGRYLIGNLTFMAAALRQRFGPARS